MIIATQRKLIGEKFTKSWGVPGGGTAILVFSDLCLPVLIVSAEIELSCFGFPASAYEYHEQRTPSRVVLTSSAWLITIITAKHDVSENISVVAECR